MMQGVFFWFGVEKLLEVLADLGGRPGLDCRGFCKYCYFKGVRDVQPLGCRRCPPFQKGCDYCTLAVRESYAGFKPLGVVLQDVSQKLFLNSASKITVSGGGDASCYPQLRSLTAALSHFGLPIHLGYTSGKGLESGDADFHLRQGVSEVTFTVFSTDPRLRREYMNDPHPEVSLAELARFAESSRVYTALVLIPGVNDGEKLYQTCSDLEEMGVEGLILMRFANKTDQGLILGNSPIIRGIKPHTIEEFQGIVEEINRNFPYRVTGTPLLDPETGAPFALQGHPEILADLPPVRRKATLLTSRTAKPLLEKVFQGIQGGELVQIIALEKDIGCLATQGDLEKLDLQELEETIIYPGRAFIHPQEAKKILTKDGIQRIVTPGPERLTMDGEMSIALTQKEVLEFEIEAFTELISQINALGKEPE